jgi:hypothetical protein
MTIRFLGFDSSGIARVYGDGATADIAETRCRQTALEYVQGRPDCRPLSAWRFELESND